MAKYIKVEKKRADILLVENNLAASREQAKALIMSGVVLCNDKLVKKSGDLIPCDSQMRLKGQTPYPWVSRGGVKLKAAIDGFSIDIRDKICMDVGSSTGGFSDVLLHHGACHIYAIDVGRNQLHWKLRNDKRITVMEGVNARHVKMNDFAHRPDIIVCDASFIGLEKVLESVLDIAKENSALVALIKPQFQLARADIGKGGIVSDPALHKKACDFVQNWLDDDKGWRVHGLLESPITGQTGNKEFLIYATK